MTVDDVITVCQQAADRVLGFPQSTRIRVVSHYDALVRQCEVIVFLDQYAPCSSVPGADHGLVLQELDVPCDLVCGHGPALAGRI